MEAPLLAATMIVKNEERHLPDCLASLRTLGPLLSEICVYDTGSTDATIEIAEAHGARVERGYWDDDFARARSAAVAMTRAKWVLTIDADERLVANPASLSVLLRKGLSQDLLGWDCVNVTMVDIDASGAAARTFASPRFFRPARMRWDFSVHELPVLIDPTRTTRRQRAADPATVHLRHLGYADPAAARDKGVRNAKAAESDLGGEARRHLSSAALAKALLDRGRSLSMTGDMAGAVRDLEQARTLDAPPVIRHWAGEALVGILFQIGRLDEAEALIRGLSDEGASPHACDWMTAQLRMREHRFPEALEVLRRLPAVMSVVGAEYDAADAVQARMIAAARVGEHDEALACCVQVMSSHGRVSGHGPLLLRLWGARPVSDLAHLIRGTSDRHTADIAREVAPISPAGAQLARLLLEAPARKRPRQAPAAPVKTSAFGLPA